eukprot:superscaffoldBa00010436_g24706
MLTCNSKTVTLILLPALLVGMVFGAFDKAMKASVAMSSAFQVSHAVCSCYCVTASEGMEHRKGLGFVRTRRLGSLM